MAAAPEAAERHRRVPQRPPALPNEMYVGRSTPFAAQLARAQRLLDSGHDEIVLRGLGAAIPRAISLAVEIRARALCALAIRASTSTVSLMDDVDEGAGANARPSVRDRSCSAVELRLQRLPA